MTRTEDKQPVDSDAQLPAGDLSEEYPEALCGGFAWGEMSGGIVKEKFFGGRGRRGRGHYGKNDPVGIFRGASVGGECAGNCSEEILGRIVGGIVQGAIVGRKLTHRNRQRDRFDRLYY